MSHKEPFCATEKKGYLSLEAWEEGSSVRAGFTSRLGGVSRSPFHSNNLGLHVGDRDADVQRNRYQLCQRAGLNWDGWISIQQVHGDQIGYVSQGDGGRGRSQLQNAIPNWDGLYTDQPELLLTALFADCVPLFFYAPSIPLIGLAHAGWRGTVKGIGPQMIQRWQEEFALEPSAIHVAIGPAIHACCYEVTEMVAIPLAEQLAKFGLASKVEVVLRSLGQSGHYRCDLPQANRLLLEAAGVPAHQILQSNDCTSCNTERFYSYRKEAGKTGRMAAFIQLVGG